MKSLKQNNISIAIILLGVVTAYTAVKKTVSTQQAGDVLLIEPGLF
ncbi:hypothetical protein SNE25_19805 [Mucilaginibacter sabulilitoris]|uniref:Uncharacterized protein n=1 Tax=Mucilaginibacter sabulilitoris TaxID=1173583 RepID=A0ABZ0TIM2_9SPHI|nr:hypothetical protein [Mucilaginibacter sabulilitoris]WPU91564.1 hypothetical protein SNE25_19805 [Mucilaginibacter sabulilitoris]